MSTRILQRKIPAHRRNVDPANALYGYGYRPDWPSILSVAHDEANGERLFVITDRPCILYSAALPLQAAGLVVIGADTVLPVKFHVWMSGGVPRGATWQWAGGNTHLYDPITNQGCNAGMGTCADIPGAYTPPPLANVVGAVAGGTSATLTFDRQVVLSAGALDDAITFDGQPPVGVNAQDDYTLVFALSNTVDPGSSWNINYQPGWVATPVAYPQSGSF